MLYTFGFNDLCCAFWGDLFWQKFSSFHTECSYLKCFNNSFTKIMQRLKTKQIWAKLFTGPQYCKAKLCLYLQQQKSTNFFFYIFTLKNTDKTLAWNIRTWVSTDKPSYPSIIKYYDTCMIAPTAFITFAPSPQPVWSQPILSVLRIITVYSRI